MLVGVYLDPRRSSTTSKSAEIGNYEAFVVVHYCQLQLIQPLEEQELCPAPLGPCVFIYLTTLL